MFSRFVKLFLRFAIACAFLSAVADRFGFWNDGVVWGNWSSFVEYTHVLVPWSSGVLLQSLAVVATVAEVVLAVMLFLGVKTELAARLSGVLLLVFALSMTINTGIKSAFDFSVFTASAGAFALSTMKSKFLELDTLLFRKA